MIKYGSIFLLYKNLIFPMDSSLTKPNLFLILLIQKLFFFFFFLKLFFEYFPSKINVKACENIIQSNDSFSNDSKNCKLEKSAT